MFPGPRGCSLSVLNTGPSSEELTGVSDHDPEHIPRVWPMGPQFSNQSCPSQLTTSFSSVHSHRAPSCVTQRAGPGFGTGYGVHGWGPAVWGAVGATRVFTGGVGETTLLPLNSHCCIGLGPEMEGGPAFPTCSQHPWRRDAGASWEVGGAVWNSAWSLNGLRACRGARKLVSCSVLRTKWAPSMRECALRQTEGASASVAQCLAADCILWKS